MSNHIQDACGNIKTNAALSNTAKLLRAYMECSGIHCAKTISENLGINLRTIYRLKLDIAASCATGGTAISATTATDGTIETATCATGGTQQKEIPPTPPKEKTTTTNTCLPDRANEPAGWAALKAKFNGSTEAMVRDAQRWMGPHADRQSAIDWLSGTAEAYGTNKTLRAWTCLLTDEASGKPIKRGTALWCNTARGLRDDTPPPENIFAEQTKGVARFVRPAPGSERMTEAFRA